MFNEYGDMITIDELCEMLMIGRNRAYKLLRCGEIKGFKCGSTWKVSKLAVEDYVRLRSGL